MSYEINNYKKVANTNCTSCMVCTEGCPSNAIAYKWESPIKENFNLTHYKFNPNMFQLSSIRERFQSVHSKDFLLTESIQERDIDILLLEELNVNEFFCEFY